MLVPDRRRRLLEELRRTGSAPVERLAAALGVSSSTVRRDLADLELEGLLRRAHGGAYLGTPVESAGQPAGSSLTGHASDDDGRYAAKQRIGRAAADLVEDGATVMILAGSTTAAMLPHLSGRGLTVVTNGLEVAHALAPHADVTVVMLGGVLHREQMTLLGPMTGQNMADLHVDVLFAGAYGVHPSVGVTGAKVIQAGFHHEMLRHTESLVVLADATKLGRRGPTLLAGIDQVTSFVTDGDADPAVVAALHDHGAAVTVC